MMEEKKSMFPKKETVKVVANIDVEIAKIVENEVTEAITMVIEEASKKYYRNVEVDFSIKLK